MDIFAGLRQRVTSYKTRNLTGPGFMEWVIEHFTFS